MDIFLDMLLGTLGFCYPNRPVHSRARLGRDLLGQMGDARREPSQWSYTPDLRAPCKPARAWLAYSGQEALSCLELPWVTISVGLMAGWVCGRWGDSAFALCLSVFPAILVVRLAHEVRSPWFSEQQFSPRKAEDLFVPLNCSAPRTS